MNRRLGRRLLLIGCAAAGALAAAALVRERWLERSPGAPPHGTGAVPGSSGNPHQTEPDARDAEAFAHRLDVRPGDEIQAALEEAARLSGRTLIRVHAGTYRPAAPAQALVAFNARHDGIVLEAQGEVILTAANPDVALRDSPAYPAIVNHVVYFGDQVSARTVFRGFRITGANGFVQGPPELAAVETLDQLNKSVQFASSKPSAIESNNGLVKSHYFFTDGGAILVYGRSCPVIENVEIYGNYSSVCAGGVSVQQYFKWFNRPVRFTNCVFRDNRTAVSGSAADLLTAGSSAVFDNCLFTGNVSNTKIDCGRSGYGALTVFPDCRASVLNCTFTGNGAGADDAGSGSEYRNTIFWNNDRLGGVNPHPRFELDIADATNVAGCFIHGQTNDVRSTVSAAANTFDPPDPDFDDAYRPRHERYRGVGYRPAGAGAGLEDRAEAR